MAEPRLLISNRGEIALRILRTAKKLGICTVAIYTLADATTPHVSRADEAYLIGDGMDPRGYLNIDLIVDIAKRSKATMVAPGYGFLSENAVSFVYDTSMELTSGIRQRNRSGRHHIPRPYSTSDDVNGSEARSSSCSNQGQRPRRSRERRSFAVFGRGSGRGNQDWLPRVD